MNGLQKIKEWYTNTYPEDELGDRLLENITFGDLFEAMDNYHGVYKTLFGKSSLGDSLIRERIFERLAEIMECDYDEVYQQWLKCKEPTSYLVHFDSCEEAEKYAKEHSIKNYSFYTPIYTENRVDMGWEEE